MTDEVAAVLREAAALMRSRADEVGSGWQHASRVVRRCDDYLGAAAVGYFASLHPAVALAVADVMDEAAAWIDEGLGACPEIRHTNYPDAWSGVVDMLARIARTYLGTDVPDRRELPVSASTREERND